MGYFVPAPRRGNRGYKRQGSKRRGFQDRQAEAEPVLSRVHVDRDQGGSGASRPLALLGRSASMEAGAHGDQEAAERERRGGRRGRGARIGPPEEGRIGARGPRSRRAMRSPIKLKTAETEAWPSR